MTLYRLLHGHSWYIESDLPRLSIADGRFRHKLKWLPHIPARWRRAIGAMMQDDPMMRTQSVGQAQAIFSGLPIEPNWFCEFDGNDVRWTLQKSARTLRVEWKRHAPRRHEWKAWSEPTNGKGNNRKLGGSKNIIGKTQAVRELEKFFSN